MPSRITNPKAIDNWIWHHTMVLHNSVVSIKDDAGRNVKWRDTTTNETIDVLYKEEFMQ